MAVVALGGAALHGPATDAQVRGATQELQIYTGETSEDRITGAAPTGASSLLDDAVTFGARYTHYFTDQWGLQLSAGYNPTRSPVPVEGDSPLDLTTFDLDLVRNITPGFTIGGHTVTPYAEAGLGFAWADLNHRLYGVIGATPVVLTDSGGYTANMGVGIKCHLTPNLFIGFDARYRYLSTLLHPDGRDMNSGEATLSVNYRF